MFEKTIGEWTVRGRSLGGFGTALHVKELGVSLDVGFFIPEILKGDHLFLSHGHPDHLGALVSWLGARRLLGMRTANIFAPVGLADGLVTALAQWQELSGVEFDYRIFGAAAGAELHLRGDIIARAFPTLHPIESLGYLFERQTKRLRQELRSKSGEEIRVLRQTRPPEELFEEIRTPLVAYVPDTLPEALDQMPEGCWDAQLLMVECTYLDDRKGMENIRKGGHVCLDDILSRLPRFNGKHIGLFHFSRIYPKTEILEILKARLPAEWRDRVVPLI